MENIQAGVLGIVQAILVVTVVWYVCFWIARKLRADDDFAAGLHPDELVATNLDYVITPAIGDLPEVQEAVVRFVQRKFAP